MRSFCCLFLNPIVDYAGYTGDQVLQRIIQNAEQIKTAVRDASKLLKELLSWFVISEEDYTSYCKTSSMSHAVVEQLIGYLIQEENRVKTRSFIRVLSEMEEVDPKLQRWMKHLDDLGKLCSSTRAYLVIIVRSTDEKITSLLPAFAFLTLKGEVKLSSFSFT